MIERLAGGGYSISDEIDIPGEGITDFIFTRGWLLEIVRLTGGEYYFYSDGQEVRPVTGHFGVFYPPFTFVRAFARDMRGRVRGVGSHDALPGLPATPFIFETDFEDSFTNVDQAFDVLRSCRDRRPITVNTRPSLISLRVKKLIDENYLIYPSISRIATRLNVSHEHLSRQFKKDYGLSPSKYLHELRGAEAAFRLSLGEEIIDISADVGYNDLSRFYKQFRKQYGMPPGRCRETKFEMG